MFLTDISTKEMKIIIKVGKFLKSLFENWNSKKWKNVKKILSFLYKFLTFLLETFI